MRRTTRRFFSASAVALCMGLVALSSVARAASINYGNYNVPSPPGSVDFLQVTESSGTDPVPLYGAPDPFAVGLDFDPTSFVATSANGGADITDGQLNFTVMGNGGVGVNFVSIFEAGDYTIAGLGTPATSVFAGAIARATVTQVNGVNIAPVSLVPSNASVGFALPPAQIAQPWSLGTGIDVGAQVFALFGPGKVATKVEIVVNNTLLAISQPGTIAFIAKKDFRVDIIPGTYIVPEPATAGLALLALAGLAGVRKRS